MYFHKKKPILLPRSKIKILILLTLFYHHISKSVERLVSRLGFRNDYGSTNCILQVENCAHT